MSRFRVMITRDTSESAWIEVEADTENEAVNNAVQKVRRDATVGSWEQDDYLGDPYFCGDEELIEHDPDDSCAQCGYRGTLDDASLCVGCRERDRAYEATLDSDPEGP